MSSGLALDADDDRVVLVDEAGKSVGTANRLAVHTAHTPLHLAFSVYLFDREGRVLITRRALDKTTWPGVWSNSCCGHPRPGETVETAVRRRVREELGITVHRLVPALPDFRYRARDASGIVENEICPVFVGFVDDQALSPDRDEVAEFAWVDFVSLAAAAAATPAVYSPWCVLQLAQLNDHVNRLTSLSPPQLSVSLESSLTEVDALLAHELDRLQAAWDAFNATSRRDILPLDLPSWLQSLLVGQGKRLRVAMTHWGFVAAGGRPGGPGHDAMVRAAAALETLHLFALVHDDVMDESRYRRGQLAAHVTAERWHAESRAAGDSAHFGRNIAVLLGDLAHMQADRLVHPLPTPLRELWYELCVELIAGQRADLTGAAARRRDLGHAEHVAQLKSGSYTITRPLQLGALAAGAGAPTLAALTSYGHHVGQAFALRDDVLGVWGDPALTGKPSGDDLAEGKATVILALAHNRLAGEAAEALLRLGTRALRPGDVALVQQALVECGVRDDVEALIISEVEAALGFLNAGVLTSAGADGLAAAARHTAWRTS